MSEANTPFATLMAIGLVGAVFVVPGTALAGHCNPWQTFWSPDACRHDPDPPAEPCEGRGDLDGDRVCDDVDPDIDGDAIPNECDEAERSPGGMGDYRDTDMDGLCDKQDEDDDNDAVPDECDTNPDTQDPLDWVKYQVFWGGACENGTSYCNGTGGGEAARTEEDDPEPPEIKAESIREMVCE